MGIGPLVQPGKLHIGQRLPCAKMLSILKVWNHTVVALNLLITYYKVRQFPDRQNQTQLFKGPSQDRQNKNVSNGTVFGKQKNQKV